MNGTVAQAAALAAHAKASRLDPRAGGDAEYWRRHSTFKFVKAVTFGVRRRRLLRSSVETVASDPAAWFSRFADLPADAVSLVPVPMSGIARHIAAAFADPADHGILVGRQVWVGAWAPTHRDDPEQRIWSVTYAPSTTFMSAVSADLDHARAELAAALREIVGFARSRSALTSWTGTFEEALSELDRDDPRPLYHPDILPEGRYGLRARRLLAAAARAWVFGGMGSWNDVWIENDDDQPRYVQLTRRLYDAVRGAIASAVNRGLH